MSALASWALRNSSPFIVGIMRSSRINDGRCARARLNASTPFVAVTTCRPADSSAVANIVRLSGSSSTSKIGRGVNTGCEFMLFLLSPTALAQESVDHSPDVRRESLLQRVEPPHDHLGLRGVKCRGKRTQQCVCVVWNTRGHLVPHLRTLLASRASGGTADATFFV